MLDAHNTHRNNHGVPPLELDDDLNHSAQTYAEKLACMNTLVHSDTKGLGENLYECCSSDVLKSVDGKYVCSSSTHCFLLLFKALKPLTHGTMKTRIMISAIRVFHQTQVTSHKLFGKALISSASALPLQRTVSMDSLWHSTHHRAMLLIRLKKMFLNLTVNLNK
jgi:hypothetical protein